MNISLADWPFESMFESARFKFNLTTYKDHPITRDTPWEEVYGVILAFIRHDLTDYDEVVTDSNREELHKQIERAAVRRYPWLRLGRDPREGQNQDIRVLLPLDEIARSLSGLHDLKYRVLGLIQKRPKEAKYRKTLKEIEDEISHENQLLSSGSEKVRWIVGRKNRCTVKFTPSHLKLTGVRCERCKRIVQRSKRPVNVGQGRWVLVYECDCIYMMIDPPPPGQIVSEATVKEHWKQDF